MADLKAIGARMRARRGQLKLSTRRIGELVGVSHVTVATWERGEAKSVDSDKLQAVAAALGMPYGQLVFGDEHEAFTTGDIDRHRQEEDRQFGQDVVLERSHRRWTRKETAARMGIDARALSEIEEGDRRARPLERYRVQKLLGIKRPGRYQVEDSYLLLRALPRKWPDGLVAFIASAESMAAKLQPMEVLLLAAGAMHPEYWKPRGNDGWAELLEALRADFPDIKFTAVPDVGGEYIAELERAVAEANYPEVLGGRDECETDSPRA